MSDNKNLKNEKDNEAKDSVQKPAVTLKQQKNKEKAHFLTGKEQRRITKDNNTQIKYYENKKKRKVRESVYITQMKTIRISLNSRTSILISLQMQAW